MDIDKTNQHKPHCTAILLAAGQGSRMGGEIPKHYIDLGGVPMLMHSLRVLTESEVITDIVMVVASGDEEYCAQLCSKHSLSRKVRIFTHGGAERYDSVYNGLMAINWKCDYVFIHDSARPFISEENLQDLLREVCEHKACVAAVPAKDTVKISNPDGFVDHTPVRSTVWIVQTPQVFERRLITEAYKKMAEDLREHRGATHITDDAMVAERYANCDVKLVMASYRNIKVTTPEDMLTAEALLEIEGSPFAETAETSVLGGPEVSMLMGMDGLDGLNGLNGVGSMADAAGALSGAGAVGAAGTDEEQAERNRFARAAGNIIGAEDESFGPYGSNSGRAGSYDPNSGVSRIPGMAAGTSGVNGMTAGTNGTAYGAAGAVGANGAAYGTGTTGAAGAGSSSDGSNLLHIDPTVLARIIARRINASVTTSQRAIARQRRSAT